MRAFLQALCLLALACSESATPANDPATPAAAHPVGDCTGCHADETAAWRASHHARGQRLSLPADLPGRFDGSARRAGELRVTPRLVDGEPAFQVVDEAGEHVLPVRGTLGVSPLVQYLLEAPGGRLVVAPLAWDVTAERFFDPAPEGGVGRTDDALHWAGLAGTWNHMCATCHATGVEKSFDPERRTYRTTTADESVGCTACHGTDGRAELSTQAAELAICGPCHARREDIAPGHAPGAAFLDHFVPVLLDSGAYTREGGLKAGEEVFELGPFMQSKMYAAGVRCTDCHEPHGGGLRAPGNTLCGRCHEPGRYDTKTHHGHRPDTDAARCTTCHMPSMTYMGVDVRHDHHIRVPDPVGSRALGESDPCSACHGDTLPREALPAERTVATTFGRLARAAEAGQADAGPTLRAMAVDPALGSLRRATALSLLTRLPPGNDEDEVVRAAADPDALVRRAAVAALAARGRHLDVVEAALRDPVRAVRLAALRGLVGRPVRDVSARDAALRDIERAAAADADLPSAHTNLAVYRWGKGDHAGARRALERALALDPNFAPARDNLARLAGPPRR